MEAGTEINVVYKLVEEDGDCDRCVFFDTIDGCQAPSTCLDAGGDCFGNWKVSE